MTQYADMVGQLIAGRYRVERVLGTTPAGSLLQAEHVLTERGVVLRWPLPGARCASDLREHFTRLSRIAISMRHPHVADVLDMGFHGETPFLVLEPLCGESLEQRLQGEKRLAPAELLHALLPILGAVACLHDAGFVHGALDATQIFLCTDAGGTLTAKLIDVGTAQPIAATPREAARPFSVHDDIRGLGALFCRGIAGEESLAGCESPYGATFGDAPTERPRLSGLPLAMALERAFRREHESSYRSPRELAEALVAAARSGGIALPENPDPVGLPAYGRWLMDARPLETTLQLEGGAPLTPEVISASASGLARDSSEACPPSKPRKSFGRAALVVLVLVAGITWFGLLRARPHRDARAAGSPDGVPVRELHDLQNLPGADSPDAERATREPIEGGAAPDEPAGSRAAGRGGAPRSPGGVAIELEWQ